MRRIFQLTLLVAWLAPMTAVAAQQNQPPPRQQTSDNGTTKQSHYGQHPPYNNAAQPSQSGSATQGAAGGTQASAFSPPARSGMQRLQNVPVNRYNQISPMAPNIQNPLANSKAAVVEGKRLFKAMNCAGCHAPGGGGGMGPALSDSVWVYGDTPADIYLSIMHGRPGGMPAWGGALPPQAIWALVTYVKTLPRPRTGYKVESKLTGPAKQAVPKAEIPKKRPSQLPSAHPPDKQSKTTQ
ncbi:MAG TPA: c-type cytochrome, partial [Gammaproteobacteria bacterium]|nr:c-type cytochrome [Gammaproteobacteria bacterium]